MSCIVPGLSLSALCLIFRTAVRRARLPKVATNIRTKATRRQNHESRHELPSLARHSSGRYTVCSEIAFASASQPGQRIPTSEACAFPASWSGWPGFQIGGRARDHPVASPCSSPLGRSAYCTEYTQ